MKVDNVVEIYLVVKEFEFVARKMLEVFEGSNKILVY